MGGTHRFLVLFFSYFVGWSRFVHMHICIRWAFLLGMVGWLFDLFPAHFSRMEDRREAENHTFMNQRGKGDVLARRRRRLAWTI